MILISRYVREQNPYSRKDLVNLFNLDDESFSSFIKKLNYHRVLKVYDKSTVQDTFMDLNESDEIYGEDFSNDEYVYVFTYVGVLTIDNFVIKCFPKYISKKEEPYEEMKEILNVINKYNNTKENIINLYSGYDEEKEFNLLSICLYLLNNYYENGIYSNQQDIVETNGEGEILWDNTINETFALIIDDIPYYTELQTQNIVNNESDYITRLHKFVITECCKKLKEADLLELFDMDDINLSDEEIEFFGDYDNILYRIQRELSVQFITWKQILLKTLAVYFSNRKSFNEGLGLAMYGTSSFHTIWEEACAKVFDNKLKTPLEELNLPLDLHEDYISRRTSRLIDIIEYPIWLSFDDGINEHKAQRTLIPDLVSIYEAEEGACFGIFDAKYYNIVLEKDNLKNYPQLKDVTKQYLYQLAFNDFIDKHNFVFISNAFLMPTEDESSVLIGEAKMGILEGLSHPNLINISVVKLSARKIYDCYLTGKKLDIGTEFEFLNNIIKEKI